MKRKAPLLLWLSAILLSQCQPKEVEISCEANQVNFDFENSLQHWVDTGGSGESAFENDITQSKEFAANGEHSVKFTVSPESYVANGNRAELTYDDGAVAGEEKWYSWKILIPSNYPDTPMRDAEFEPNWQLMGQWHQQPVVQDGETWENFTGQGESPSVGINYYYLAANDSDYQNLKKDEKMLAVPGFDPSWDDVSVFFLTYGTPPVPVAITQIEKGQWIDVLVNIHWSEGEEGYIRTWINGEEITDGKTYGPNMWNRASHYFKFGLYKNPDIPHTNIVYYDDVKIGYCREEVE